MGYEEIFLDAEEKLDKTVEVLVDDLRKIRTGRANPGLVEGLRVACYGGESQLKQVAQVSVIDAQMLSIRPFDPSIMGDIEKAILKSDLGIKPTPDGKILRLSIPPLSEERRRQMASLVGQYGEKAKVSIRNIRRDAMKSVSEEQKGGEITEDDAKRGEEEIQKTVKDHEAKVDDLVKRKSEELMKI